MQLSVHEMTVLNAVFKHVDHQKNIFNILKNTKGSGEPFIDLLDAYARLVQKFCPETSMDDLDNLIFDAMAKEVGCPID